MAQLPQLRTTKNEIEKELLLVNIISERDKMILMFYQSAIETQRQIADLEKKNAELQQQLDELQPPDQDAGSEAGNNESAE